MHGTKNVENVSSEFISSPPEFKRFCWPLFLRIFVNFLVSFLSMLMCYHLLTGCRPLGRDIVHIKVGEEEQDFDIHKGLTSLLLTLLLSCFELGIRRG